MAYGKNGRQGLHRDGMRQHGFWTTDDEWGGFVAVAEDHGLTPVGLVRAIGLGEMEVSRHGGRDSGRKED